LVVRGAAILGLSLLGCGGDTSLSVEVIIGDPVQPGASDPPYSGAVAFPSGLRLTLVQDGTLTGSYPAPAGNPFGGTRQRHYERVGYFIDLPRAPLAEMVSPNFRLSEYVNPTVNRGGRRAYVDPQIADHVQQIRSGLGRPLVLSSAFRSPEHNRAVGGASYSRHQYGDAVDIDVDQNRSDADERAQEMFNEARDVGVDYVQPLLDTSVTVDGQPRVSWVHIDDRGF
jgi:hypothetical protein